MICFENEAREIALQIVKRAEHDGVPMALVDSSTQTYEDGWLFFYNSAEYLETGSFLSRSAGNGPIFVCRSGTAHCLPTHQPFEQSLAAVRSDPARYVA